MAGQQPFNFDLDVRAFPRRTPYAADGRFITGLSAFAETPRLQRVQIRQGFRDGDSARKQQDQSGIKASPAEDSSAHKEGSDQTVIGPDKLRIAGLSGEVERKLLMSGIRRIYLFGKNGTALRLTGEARYSRQSFAARLRGIPTEPRQQNPSARFAAHQNPAQMRCVKQ